MSVALTAEVAGHIAPIEAESTERYLRSSRYVDVDAVRDFASDSEADARASARSAPRSSRSCDGSSAASAPPSCRQQYVGFVDAFRSVTYCLNTQRNSINRFANYHSGYLIRLFRTSNAQRASSRALEVQQQLFQGI